jgi:hypothetical protein
MIKKTLIIFCLLFITFSALHWFIIPEGLYVEAHTSKESYMKIQRYLYLPDKFQLNGVIVGSSMSGGISEGCIPGVYNFALCKCNALQGAEVLIKSNKFPKYVFVEINRMENIYDTNFITERFDPVMYYPRKLNIALREGKQPLVFLGGLFWIYFNRRQLKQPGNQEQCQKIFENMLNMQKDRYNKPDSIQIAKNVSVLKRYVTILEAKGVKVIFFEMPINPELIKTPLSNISRELIKKTFPSCRYDYIPMDSSNSYKTLDGIHIGGDEVIRYTEFFKKYATDIIFR